MRGAIVHQLHEEGYAIVRGFLPPDALRPIRAAVDAVQAEGMKHHATYRHKNLCFEILNDPLARRRVLLQAYWFSWVNEVLEAQRRDMRYLEVLEPCLGRDIKQISNQIHWKPPGAKFTGYRFHQDLRFRERKDLFSDLADGYLTTGLAIDRHDDENGALQVFPGSHKLGYLGLSDEGGAIMKGQTPTSELEAAGLDPADAVTCRLDPGDLLVWTLYTVHGSAPNRSQRDRPFLLNSYLRADTSLDRGEWAFRDGRPVPLGPEPRICRYEDLYDRPEPFYIEDNWAESEGDTTNINL